MTYENASKLPIFLEKIGSAVCTILNTLNFAEKALVGGKMQPLKNAFELTYHPERMRPRLYAESRERVRAYARCRENATALRAPIFLDPSGPTDY